VVANFFKPGAGMNINPASLDTKAISVYTTGKHLGPVDFIMNIIPKDIADSFAKATSSRSCCSPSSSASRWPSSRPKAPR